MRHVALRYNGLAYQRAQHARYRHVTIPRYAAQFGHVLIGQAKTAHRVVSSRGTSALFCSLFCHYTISHFNRKPLIVVCMLSCFGFLLLAFCDHLASLPRRCAVVDDPLLAQSFLLSRQKHDFTFLAPSLDGVCRGACFDLHTVRRAAQLARVTHTNADVSTDDVTWQARRPTRARVPLRPSKRHPTHDVTRGPWRVFRGQGATTLAARHQEAPRGPLTIGGRARSARPLGARVDKLIKNASRLYI